jgi:uncharacterized protein YutE (UPF0331/DUF86 family)
VIRDVDPERIRKLISCMRDSVQLLAEIQGASEPDFRADRHKQSSAKYNFIVAIEAAIDIANHLISKRGFRAPEDYADTFRVLADANVIEENFALELARMARFRNRLVHLYWEVDPSEVWKIIQSRLDDFEDYISQVGKYLDRKI